MKILLLLLAAALLCLVAVYRLLPTPVRSKLKDQMSTPDDYFSDDVELTITTVRGMHSTALMLWHEDHNRKEAREMLERAIQELKAVDDPRCAPLLAEVTASLEALKRETTSLFQRQRN